MKKPEEFIKKIPVIKSNFEYISKTGIINGSLRIDIERCMHEYVQQFLDRIRFL